MKVYIQVTRDKYELPVAVADSPSELARMTGANRNTVNSTLALFRKGKYKNPKYREVEIDDD